MQRIRDRLESQRAAHANTDKNYQAALAFRETHRKAIDDLLERVLKSIDDVITQDRQYYSPGRDLDEVELMIRSTMRMPRYCGICLFVSYEAGSSGKTRWIHERIWEWVRVILQASGYSVTDSTDAATDIVEFNGLKHGRRRTLSGDRMFSAYVCIYD